MRRLGRARKVKQSGSNSFLVAGDSLDKSTKSTAGRRLEKYIAYNLKNISNTYFLQTCSCGKGPGSLHWLLIVCECV